MNDVCYYAACAVAPNTRRTYTAGEQRFLDYCHLCHWQPYPATDFMLSCFCAFLARSVRPGTISVYLQAVRNAHIEQGLEDPLVDSWLLKRVLKGVQRCHGTETVKPRLPITMPVLRRLIAACCQCSAMSEHDRCLYQSVLTLAFFGFLRCAEIVEGLSRESITFQSGSIQILLRRSKADPLGKGVKIDVGPAAPPCCPVQALLAYLARSRHLDPTGPLFVLASGKPLTRSALVETVRMLLNIAEVPNAQLYSGHSFRIGAATTAAMAGVPDSLIRAAGRWQSDVCLRYMRIPTAVKCQLSSQLASVTDLV